MLKLFAPAKINLHLHVTGKREDGYHLLDSLVAFTDAGDYLSFEPAPNYQLDITGPFARTLDGENLVTKAANIMARYLGREPKIHITLEKNLPLGAGIGGGSADAAACLQGLNEFWSANLKEADLLTLAAQIGADIPACIKSQAIVMRGIGEIIEPAPTLPSLSAVLIWPDCFASTPAVYKDLRMGIYSRNFKFHENYESTVNLISDLVRTSNDLQETSVKLFPPIGSAIDALNKSGSLFSRMSGSGSTVFGIFKNEDAAQNAAGSMAKKRPDWWVRPVKIN